MAKGKGKKFRNGHSSNPQSSGSGGIEKRVRKENRQQASRINIESPSVPTIAPTYGFVPAYPNVSAFPSTRAHNANGSWASVHEENMFSMDQLSGYIFMCNGNTKADCYKYRVFGLPAARMDVLEKIKPRMKLFLFDFDLRLLHGIYTAASNGELAIEPTAFGGKFSAQVRFEIFKDCLPLPESAFRHIIKDNYRGGHKFSQELSGKQVTNLISLFRPIAMPPPVQNEPPGFEVLHALATRIQPMHLLPAGVQPPSEPFYPAEAHQVYRPENRALPPQDPYSRFVAVPRDQVLSPTNVSAQAYASLPPQFSTPLRDQAHLPSSTQTAAYWAAVASESLKQDYHTPYRSVPVASEGRKQVYHAPYPSMPVASEGLKQVYYAPYPSMPVASEGLKQVYHTPYQSMPVASEDLKQVYHTAHPSMPVASEGLKQAYPTDYQSMPSGSMGRGVPVASAGAALPPPTVPENIDAELLQHLGPANDYNHNPAVGSANAVVQAPAVVPLQSQVPSYGAVPLPSSSSTSGYWTTAASKDPNLLYSGPYQWQWQPSATTGAGPENVSVGSAPPYTAVPGSANEFVPPAGAVYDYYNQNSNLSTNNIGPVQPYDQVAYYASAPAYWTVDGSQDPNQLSSGSYRVLPPGSSGIGGEHQAASVTGTDATND